MAGYVIVSISVSDPEGFKAYQAAVSPNIKAFGGKYLVRGGAVEAIEGATDGRRLVVLEFPSVEGGKDLVEFAGVSRDRQAARGQRDHGCGCRGGPRRRVNHRECRCW